MIYKYMGAKKKKKNMLDKKTLTSSHVTCLRKGDFKWTRRSLLNIRMSILKLPQTPTRGSLVAHNLCMPRFSILLDACFLASLIANARPHLFQGHVLLQVCVQPSIAIGRHFCNLLAGLAISPWIVAQCQVSEREMYIVFGNEYYVL